jgi:hypothetical protein
MNESLQKAKDDIDFTCDDLRESLRGAGNVESIIIL